MRFLTWLKNVIVGQGVRSKVNKFSAQLSALQVEQRAWNRQVAVRRKELDTIKEALAESENRLRETVEEALRIQRKQDVLLEGAKDQIKIMEEMTIPALMQSNSVLFERWKAETRVQAYRLVAQDRTTHTEGE